MPVQRAQNIGRGVRQEPAPRDRTLGQEPIGYKDWSRASGRGDKVIILGDYGGHSFADRGRVDRIKVALIFGKINMPTWINCGMERQGAQR